MNTKTEVIAYTFSTFLTFSFLVLKILKDGELSFAAIIGFALSSNLLIHAIKRRRSGN